MMDTIEKQQMWTHSIVTVKPLASSAIMTNNLAVSLTIFALGITAGIGTRVDARVQWPAFRRGLRRVLACRNARAADEFCCAARRARIAGHFHCGRRGPADGEGLAVSRNSAAPRIGSFRRRRAPCAWCWASFPCSLLRAPSKVLSRRPNLAVKWKYTLAAGLFGLLLLYLMRKGPKSASVVPDDAAPISVAPSETTSDATAAI